MKFFKKFKILLTPNGIMIALPILVLLFFLSCLGIRILENYKSNINFSWLNGNKDIILTVLSPFLGAFFAFCFFTYTEKLKRKRD